MGDTSRPALSHGRQDCSERGTRPTPREKLFVMGDTSRPALSHERNPTGDASRPARRIFLPWGTRPAPRFSKGDASLPARQPLDNAVEALRQDLLVTQLRLCEKGAMSLSLWGRRPTPRLEPDQKKGGCGGYVCMNVSSHTRD